MDFSSSAASTSMDRQRSRSPRSRAGTSREHHRHHHQHRHHRRDDEEERRQRRADREAEKRQELEMTYRHAANVVEDKDIAATQFVWAKKKRHDRKAGLTAKEAEEREQRRRVEAKEELRRLAEKREERERQFQAKQEEDNRIGREAENAKMKDWLEKEDDFILEQAKRGAEIRIKQGRSNPVDFLVIHLRLGNQSEWNAIEDAGLEAQMVEPSQLLDTLASEELLDLHRDVQMYLKLEKVESHLEFWRLVLILAHDRLERLNPQTDYRLPGSVLIDIKRLLSPKTYAQLSTLQTQVRDKLDYPDSIDVDYWQEMLRQITVFKAKARLQELHKIVIANQFDLLRERQRQEAVQAKEAVVKTVQTDIPEEGEDSGVERWTESMEPMKFDRIRFEDELLRIINPDEDRRSLLEARSAILNQGFVRSRKHDSMTKHMQKGARAHSQIDDNAVISSLVAYETRNSVQDDENWEPGDEENPFNEEIRLESRSNRALSGHAHDDKYRPRKPRYFNKIFTGYEWTKYNQTHFDESNPPPKVCLGYAFHIAYPDLIDITKAPTYQIKPDRENDQTATIIFKAGPPYEDVAFRIIYKPIAMGKRNGYVSRFDRGILTLQFRFKRDIFRR